jgi:hypothetical protein
VRAGSAKIAAHPKLNPAQAAAALTALMNLKAPPDLIPAGAFNGDMGAARMGALAFNKLRGCTACHQGEADRAGCRAELTDAGLRLRPFHRAYTADPQRLDPNVWMPSPKLKDADIKIDSLSRAAGPEIRHEDPFDFDRRRRAVAA